MSQTKIDPELLITLIEIRPILWDKTLENYKDNNLRTAAWREVCIVLREDFQELEEKERQSYAKMVVKKWNQIRDSWKRSLNAKKKINKSGSAAVYTKNYCYNDQLLFLKTNMDPAETQDSGGNKATNIVEGDTENPIQNEGSENEPTIEHGSPGQENPAGGAKRLKRSVLPRQRLSVMDQKMASFIESRVTSLTTRNSICRTDSRVRTPARQARRAVVMAKFLAYDININIPMLIEEVRVRPAIYDTKSVEYLDRNKKIQLWREICEKLNKNYKDYSNIDKIAFGKEVQKKWSSLRDSFRRDLAILSFQQKLPPHSGGAKKKCKYKYFDSLLYLLPYVHVNKTNGLSVVTPSDIPSEQSQDTEPQAELMESTSDWYYNESQPSPESVTIKRPRTDSDVSAAMNMGDRQTNNSILHDISDRTLYEDDDDKLFLLSLVPSFRDYSIDEKYLLRIELMQTIMRFKQSRRENEGTLAGSIKTEVDSHTVN